MPKTSILKQMLVQKNAAHLRDTRWVVAVDVKKPKKPICTRVVYQVYGALILS